MTIIRGRKLVCPIRQWDCILIHHFCYFYDESSSKTWLFYPSPISSSRHPMVDDAGCCAHRTCLFVKGDWWRQRRTQVVGVTGRKLGPRLPTDGVDRKGWPSLYMNRDIDDVTRPLWKGAFSVWTVTRRRIADRTYPLEDLWLCGWGRGVVIRQAVWIGDGKRYKWEEDYDR